LYYWLLVASAAASDVSYEVLQQKFSFVRLDLVQLQQHCWLDHVQLQQRS
jgi:hypothetical protein